MSLHPYLMFSGNCREAFTRYQEIFGGQLDLMTLDEMPADAEAPPTDNPDFIIHAALSFGDNLLMASDDPGGDGAGVKGCAVSYTLDDPAEAERVFAELSAGGEVTMPIGETFWSPKFGMCTDRFGTPWMVGLPSPDQTP